MERAGGEGRETLPMPSLPVKAGSWRQGMYEDTALSPETVGARSRCGGALALREWGGKRLRAGEKQSQQGDRDRDSRYGAPCDRCPHFKWGTAVSDSNDVDTDHRNRMSLRQYTGNVSFFPQHSI